MTAETASLIEHLGRLTGELRMLLVQAERDEHERAMALHALRLAASEVEMQIRAIEGVL
jgi:hypothetical protein